MSGCWRVQRNLDRGQAEARRHGKQKGQGAIANGDLETSSHRALSALVYLGGGPSLHLQGSQDAHMKRSMCKL